jgi:hypothetical protein
MAEPAPAQKPQPKPAPVEEAEPDAIAEAEQYAAIYPERAALIRRTGRVPHNASFGPPDWNPPPSLSAPRGGEELRTCGGIGDV